MVLHVLSNRIPHVVCCGFHRCYLLIPAGQTMAQNLAGCLNMNFNLPCLPSAACFE
jgi:hypothetical protein